MAVNPLHSQVDLPTHKVLVKGKEIKESYELKSITIAKEINRISYAKIMLYDGDPAEETFEISESSEFIPGNEIKIQLGYHNNEEDAFEGIITSHDVKITSYAHKMTSLLVVTCHDKSIKMTIARKSANFKEKKDSEVLSSLIRNHGVSSTIKATGYKHRNLVQYNCSDWDFVLSRTEANGRVVINEPNKLIIDEPKVSGDAVLDLNYGTNIFQFKAEMNARYQYDSVEVQSWDSTQQKINKGSAKEPAAVKSGNIAAKNLAASAGKAKLQLRTSTPEDPALIKSYADAQLQRSRMSKIKGEVSFPGNLSALPGKLINLKGFGDRFNGVSYINGITHELIEGKWTTTVSFGLPPGMFSDREDITGPAASGLLPAIRGIHIGKVKQIDSDPDGEFRVLVDVPVIKDTGDGIWARLANGYASSEFGMYFYPEVGDEVILGFLDSDPRFGVILGSLYGKKLKPPFTPEKKNKDKAIVTKSKMKITFDEEDKIVTIETPGGQKATLSDKDKSLQFEDQNKNKIVMDKNGIMLDSAKDITLKANGKGNFSAMSNIGIDSKGDVSLKGNNINTKANIALSAQGTASAELKASGNVAVKGALVMIN